MATCGACGGQLGPDDNFCGSCGASVPLGQLVHGPDASTGQGATRHDGAAGLWSAAPARSETRSSDDAIVHADVADADVVGAGVAAEDAAEVAAEDAVEDAAEGVSDEAEVGSGSGGQVDPGDPASTAARVVQVPVDDEPTSTTLHLDETSVMAPTAVVGPGSGVDLVTCRTCNAVNAAQRAKCAQCGGSLGDTNPNERDRVLPDPDPQSAPAPQTRRGSRSGRAGLPTWAWVIIAGVLVGGGIGVATSFGFGPLAAEDGTGIEFRAQAYPDAPVTLAPSLVGGSDVREPAAGRDFTAANVLDGDVTTAWAPLESMDATVTFRFDAPVWITAIELANGDQFDADTFDQTGRVRLADLDMRYGQVVEATLLDGVGRQVLRIPSPVLTTQLDLQVRELIGADNVAISELRIIGHPASPRDTADYREL